MVPCVDLAKLVLSDPFYFPILIDDPIQKSQINRKKIGSAFGGLSLPNTNARLNVVSGTRQLDLENLQEMASETLILGILLATVITIPVSCMPANVSNIRYNLKRQTYFYFSKNRHF